MPITIDAKASAEARESLVTTTVFSGDHLIMTRRGDPKRRKAILTEILKRTESKTYDPAVETAEESLEAIRNRG